MERRDEQPRYVIYVIELGPTARNLNPGSGPHRRDGLPCLYVGGTLKNVQDRFRDHRSGLRQRYAARPCINHPPLKLRSDLAGGKYGLSRETGERIEARLAESLRRRGYGVFQG